MEPARAMGGLSHAEAPARRARSELRGHAPPAIQSTASTSDVYTSRGFESAPYNETDTEDPTSADAPLVRRAEPHRGELGPRRHGSQQGLPRAEHDHRPQRGDPRRPLSVAVSPGPPRGAAPFS